MSQNNGDRMTFDFSTDRKRSLVSADQSAGISRLRCDDWCRDDRGSGLHAVGVPQFHSVSVGRLTVDALAVTRRHGSAAGGGDEKPMDTVSAGVLAKDTTILTTMFTSVNITYTLTQGEMAAFASCLNGLFSKFFP
ncbi:hypothetical protein SKAU_G00295380 [Synaphobranchus kaupii]|uniref:Uncharacterized protein n=1 Tax=Synaphobranchus kaupii TaxID=118154 RepID=A0A9Q1EUM3_SYNKA|nr:hypothetical protein SKAU_G00295380 [Synaphobranchus kaupii]